MEAAQGKLDLPVDELSAVLDEVLGDVGELLELVGHVVLRMRHAV